MTYRDDLTAAQGRIRQLEEELGEARQTISELERRLTGRNREKEPRRRPERTVRRLGRLTFKSAPTYFPLFRLLARAASVAFRRYPKTRPLETRVLALWLAYWALYWPLLTLVYRPLYLVGLVFPVLPVAGLLTVAFGLVLAPFIFISRFRIGDEPARDPKWLRGEFTDGEAGIALWILLSCCMQPLLLLYTSLLTANDD